MRHLLDAHSLIWALDDPRKPGKRAVAVLEDPANELLVSVGTVWEISIKAGLGKLSLLACLGNPDPGDMKVYCPTGKETFDDDETTEEAPS